MEAGDRHGAREPRRYRRARTGSRGDSMEYRVHARSVVVLIGETAGTVLG